MIKYFLDSNVFDFLLDNNINIENLRLQGDYYTSNIQRSEILNTPDLKKRNQLVEIYDSLKQQKLLLKSGIWLDSLRWDDEQPWIDTIGEIPFDLVKNKIKKPLEDALIGEITKVNNLVLVSSDKEFIKRAKSNKINAISTEDFINTL
jgi:predicted nucleic acid-binding protein